MFVSSSSKAFSKWKGVGPDDIETMAELQAKMHRGLPAPDEQPTLSGSVGGSRASIRKDKTSKLKEGVQERDKGKVVGSEKGNEDDNRKGKEEEKEEEDWEEGDKGTAEDEEDELEEKNEEVEKDTNKEKK
tara:strand:+ start:874 stop:1266 length:393 start_codon:yes stop_codon:yes gene_type:complete